MPTFRRDLIAIFRPHMVEQRVPSAVVQDFDALLDRAGVPRDDEPAHAEPAAAPAGALVPSDGAERIIKEFEGFGRLRADGLLEAYPDPGTGAAPWTIGYGSTGPDIVKGTVWTKGLADARFREHLAQFGSRVRKLLDGAPTSQSQFDALISLAYNIGTGNLEDSTLLRKHKARDYAGAQVEFSKWNRAAGKVLPGLVRRRAAEAVLYGRRP